MSGNLGFETYLISDSTACYNTKSISGDIIDCQEIYENSLASLNEEFAKKAAISLLCCFLWYLQESNQGHMDFQSIALPTELRYRVVRGANLIDFFT